MMENQNFVRSATTKLPLQPGNQPDVFKQSASVKRYYHFAQGSGQDVEPS